MKRCKMVIGRSQMGATAVHDSQEYNDDHQQKEVIWSTEWVRIKRIELEGMRGRKMERKMTKQKASDTAYLVELHADLLVGSDPRANWEVAHRSILHEESIACRTWEPVVAGFGASV